MRLFAFLIALLAISTASADDKPSVRLELTDHTQVRGPWQAQPITFVGEHGSFFVEPAKVKSLLFGEDNVDVLELEGVEHHFRGKANVQSLNVDGRDYSRQQIRKMIHLHPGTQNFLGRIVIPLVTLTAMEIVLGIDNIIFLAIIAGKLPTEQQPKVRRIGLIAALGTRLLLLGTLSFILGLTTPVFTLPQWAILSTLESREISWRDIILLVGGMFLIGKSTFEIHDKLEQPVQEQHQTKTKGRARFGWVLIQIAIIDIVFSLDSVITAVGMADSLWVMITAMLIAVAVMMVFAETIARFVSRNPTLKILALAFLILIGVLLVADGFGQHINKGYIYFAMAFSLVVEVFNIRLRRKMEPIRLSGDELPPGIS